MSRSFSLVGLPSEAKNLFTSLELKKIGQQEFKEYFYSDGYSFKVYEDKNGVQYEEFEAGCPWAGGPELFLGLREINTKKVVCTWTKSQMGFQEDVELPREYDLALLEALQKFVTEENTPTVQGHCPLYVHIREGEVDLFQSLLSEYPSIRTQTIKTVKRSHGETIRDYMTQKGYSVEELSVGAKEYLDSRMKYLKENSRS